MIEQRCPYSKKGNHKYEIANKVVEVWVENDFQSTKQIVSEPIPFCENCGYPILNKRIQITGPIEK